MKHLNNIGSKFHYDYKYNFIPPTRFEPISILNIYTVFIIYNEYCI